MVASEPPVEPHEPSVRSSPTVLSAMLFCENCGRSTPHRVLKLQRPAAKGNGGARGIARCRECRLTHPFASTPKGRVDIALVVSVGPTSDRRLIRLPRSRTVQVGTGIPESSEPVRVQRIDTRDGRQASSASTDDIATLWAVREVGAVVPVSIVEGPRTRARRLAVSPETRYEVGGRVTVDGIRLDVVALRARGRTWRRPGDAFVARDVQRIYGRRIAIPPAGNRDWRRGRGRPRSFASSTSRSRRSRSSPGVRRTRTVPSARTADGGATVQRSEPS